MDSSASAPSPTDTRVARFIAEARRNLIDSGTRNRLVHVNRSGRGRFLNLVNERSDDIFRLLHSEGKKMKFRATATAAMPEDDDIHFTAVDLSNFSNVQPDDDSSYTDQFLDTAVDTDALQKRLLMLARDARTAEEEQGINVLFLALGFLVWFESESSEVRREAPLVLMPVQLIRNERTSTYDLQARAEDILTNLSLQSRLREDFGLLLPAIDVTEEWTPGNYFQQVQDVIATRDGWQIDSDGMQLGLFSFAKQLMLKDLEQSAWSEDQLGNDPLLQKLLVGGFKPQEPLFGDREPLDKRLSPEDIIHVVDADAPQTRVIEEVKAGRHLVVQGPPGTGKSQTITNIIAAAVHADKTVLFMAEKMAALDVVLNRLQKCQLGHLCLELHSRHTNRKDVLQQINHTLQAADRQPAITGLATGELKTARDELNRIDELLHSPVPGCKFTAFEAMADVVGFIGQDCPPPTLEAAGLAQLDRQQQQTVETTIAKVAAVYARCGPRAAHPFAGVHRLDLGPVDQQKTWKLVQSALQQIDQLLVLGTEFAQVLDSRSADDPEPQPVASAGNSLAGLRQCSTLVQLLAAQPSTLPVLRQHLFGNPQTPALADALRTGLAWKEARQAASARFAERAWAVPAAPLVMTLAGGAEPGLGAFFTRLGGAYRGACRTLDEITGSVAAKTPAGRLQLAKALLEVEDKRRALAQQEAFLQTHLAAGWRGENTDFAGLLAAVQWLGQITATGLVDSLTELQHAEAQAPQLLAFSDRLQAAGEAPASEAIRQLLQLLDYRPAETGLEADLEPIQLDRLRQQFHKLAQAGSAGYMEWSDLQTAIMSLEEHGVGELVSLLDRQVLAPAQAVNEFNYASAAARWNHACSKLPELKNLVRLNRHELVRSFAALDEQHGARVQALIRSRHLAQLPKGAAGEMGIIHGEIAKKRRHMPIRQLMSKTGSVIQRIKPVLLMSPISIAQFLPPQSLRFDLLVIDEASQVRPEDAIGAIARCSQIVVVGDQKQLPPTSFFDRLEADSSWEDAEEEYAGVAKVTEMESILTLCEARGINQRMLQWHYRSRDPSLIAVSNLRFYDSRLILPPSPQQATAQAAAPLGMSLTRVPGVYLSSSSNSGTGRPGTNRVEAEHLARAVAEHARRQASQSLGIVTFSKSQADMVTEILERDRRNDEVLNDFLREGRDEDCFVKNIENVQGDERDVIFISVGYGPATAGGKLTSMRFGPVNAEGGERRLNVLFTRARLRCRIFASFDPADIDPARVTRAGPGMLRQYMQYAEDRRITDIHPDQGTADSPFEADVARVIRDLGYLADHQVGDSGFRIDLGVRHPDSPGRYRLAVECDGATYHRSLSARERDRHRQAVLELMGWRFHRIWSTDWFHRRSQEISRLEAALAAAGHNQHPRPPQR